jgi:hypothetical protein
MVITMWMAFLLIYTEIFNLVMKPLFARRWVIKSWKQNTLLLTQ